MNEPAIKMSGAGLESIEGKYLAFALGREEYGIGILKIREIIGMMPITPIPRSPSFVKGVINLRGKVIPVIDLRLKFNMKAKEFTDRTCIVVVELDGTAGRLTTGVVVDSVSEVLNIKGKEVEAPPPLGTELKEEYILGLAKMSSGLKILLDIDKILSSN